MIRELIIQFDRYNVGMRVTVFGASGLLGRALIPELKSDKLTVPSSADADVRNQERIQEVFRDSSPEWIILAAAYTNVDGCEANRELAFAVNCEGAVNVARAARETGARLMFLSTDYLFNGKKRSPYEADDPRTPISVYGETKARAEERLLEILPDVCIVRTSWLFGAGGSSFPATILKLAAERPEIAVVDDQRGCPTFTPDLASALVQLCRKSARGIVHATNSGDCTRYEFAKEILRMAGLPTVVKPVSSATFPRPARRPAYSVLSPATIEAYGIGMARWQDALQRYLAGTRATGA